MLPCRSLPTETTRPKPLTPAAASIATFAPPQTNPVRVVARAGEPASHCARVARATIGDPIIGASVATSSAALVSLGRASILPSISDRVSGGSLKRDRESWYSSKGAAGRDAHHCFHHQHPQQEQPHQQHHHHQLLQHPRQETSYSQHSTQLNTIQKNIAVSTNTTIALSAPSVPIAGGALLGDKKQQEAVNDGRPVQFQAKHLASAPASQPAVTWPSRPDKPRALNLDYLLGKAEPLKIGGGERGGGGQLEQGGSYFRENGSNQFGGLAERTLPGRFSQAEREREQEYGRALDKEREKLRARARQLQRERSRSRSREREERRSGHHRLYAGESHATRGSAEKGVNPGSGGSGWRTSSDRREEQAARRKHWGTVLINDISDSETTWHKAGGEGQVAGTRTEVQERKTNSKMIGGPDSQDGAVGGTVTRSVDSRTVAGQRYYPLAQHHGRGKVEPPNAGDDANGPPKCYERSPSSLAMQVPVKKMFAMRHLLASADDGRRGDLHRNSVDAPVDVKHSTNADWSTSADVERAGPASATASGSVAGFASGSGSGSPFGQGSTPESASSSPLVGLQAPGLRSGIESGAGVRRGKKGQVASVSAVGGQTQGAATIKSVAPVRSAFRCHICSVLFKRKYDLKTHIEAVHEKKRPHKCPYSATCKATFAHRGTMTKHVSTVHLRRRSFACTYPGCKAMFSERGNLNKHTARTHHNTNRPKVEDDAGTASE